MPQRSKRCKEEKEIKEVTQNILVSFCYVHVLEKSTLLQRFLEIRGGGLKEIEVF